MRILTLLLGLVVAVFMGCSDSVTPFEQSDFGATAGVASHAKKPAPSLTCTITYDFTGHLGIFDDAGRMQVWDGEIHGDVEGRILWWFVAGGGPPNMPDAAHVSFYEARWEIWDGDALLLAGDSGGSTALPPEKDGIWRGNGIVTEVSAGLEGWMDRPVKEGGSVNWDFPYSGEGFFRIN